MDKYDLYVDGEKCGYLSVKNDGHITELKAHCKLINKIIKITVFGIGEEYYLGTLKPENNEMTITKKLSRTEARKLPKNIEYAANNRLNEHNDEDAFLWYTASRGCLISYDGRQSYIALPASARCLKNSKSIRRSINGRQYLVFPGKRN